MFLGAGSKGNIGKKWVKLRVSFLYPLKGSENFEDIERDRLHCQAFIQALSYSR